MRGGSCNSFGFLNFPVLLLVMRQEGEGDAADHLEWSPILHLAIPYPRLYSPFEALQQSYHKASIMLSIRFVLLLASAAAFTTALALQSPPPGLKLTLSQDCIAYGKDWAITKLLPSLQNLHAPDVHGSSGKCT